MDSNSPVGQPGQVVASRVVGEPAWSQRHEAPKARGCLAGFFIVLLLVVLPFVLLLGFTLGSMSLADDDGIEEQFHSLSKTGSDKIAIISIEGTILDGDGFVKQQIDHIKKAKDVKAIVVRVDSPGGTVTGSDFMLHHLNELRKESGLPVVVSMGGIAASGGYYVSMAVGDTENTIFAEPTTWTGSIGVIIPHYNMSKLMETHGVESDSVASHRLKGMGSITKEMTAEERAIFQGLVDESFDRFKQIVKSGRPKMSDETLTEVATGQVFTTGQAIKHGLVDKEGFIEAAIDRAIELASLNRDDVKVVKFKQPLSFSDLLMGAKAAPPSFDLSAILDLSAPRAYYLWTSLPGLQLK